MAYSGGNASIMALGMEMLQSANVIQSNYALSLSFQVITSFYRDFLCPHLMPPEHGKIIISGYTPLSNAHYICKKGCKLSGLEVL